MNKINICKTILETIKTYIHSEDHLAAHRFPKHFTRKRLLSIQQIILFLLYSSKASMYQNLASILDDFGEDVFPDVSKQAVSKARQGIKPSLFSELFNLSSDIYYSNIDQRKNWHGYQVYAIDGTKLQLPNSTSNFEDFGHMFSPFNHNRKWSMALGSVVYDVLNDYIIHGSIQHYLYSERAAAVQHLISLEKLDIYKDAIVVFDRGYYSERLFRYCYNHKHLCLMRLKDNYKISRSCHGELITTLPGDPKVGSPDIKIRVIEVTLDNGCKEYLATNVFDTSLTAKDFKELYFLRWPVEGKYHELKSTLNIEEFNGATSISIQQEFYINLLISNLSALIKNAADEEIAKDAKTGNKYKYQANRTFIVGRVKRYFSRIILGLEDINCIEKIFREACKCKSQIQPGRSFKRPRIERDRKHFRNRKVTI